MQGETFIFFGIIGSGKGTQIELLEQYLKKVYNKDGVHIYPGNEYRKLIEAGSYVGALVQDSMNRGELQPDFLTNALIDKLLIENLSEGKNIFFDGYPRTIEQAKHTEEALKFFKRNNVKVIYIQISKEEVFKRNTERGRSDDTEEAIKKRFEEYEKKVMPAFDYLKNKQEYEFFSINGENSIENVHKDIIQAIRL